MASKLKEYFPMIREREEVLAEIAKSGIRISVSGTEERLLFSGFTAAPV